MSVASEINATEKERLLGQALEQSYTSANDVDEEYAVGLDIDAVDATTEEPGMTQCLKVPAFACIMVSLFLAAAFIEHLKTLSLVRSFP